MALGILYIGAFYTSENCYVDETGNETKFVIEEINETLFYFPSISKRIE
jgi:hypothetical protein